MLNADPCRSRSPIDRAGYKAIIVECRSMRLGNRQQLSGASWARQDTVCMTVSVFWNPDLQRALAK